jgi:hypothetical protein
VPDEEGKPAGAAQAASHLGITPLLTPSGAGILLTF